MKKIILLIGLSFLITGCGNKVEYYEDVSKVIIGFNKELTFDVDEIRANDLVAINNYKDNLKNLETKFNLSKYLIKDDSYKTNKPNSKNVYVENDECFINREDVHYEFTGDTGPLEDSVTYVCNGYMVQFLESFADTSYEKFIATRRFGYRYLGYKETDNGYLFGYRSYYDSNITTIELILSDGVIKKINYRENQRIKFE